MTAIDFQGRKEQEGLQYAPFSAAANSANSLGECLRLFQDRLKIEGVPDHLQNSRSYLLNRSSKDSLESFFGQNNHDFSAEAMDHYDSHAIAIESAKSLTMLTGPSTFPFSALERLGSPSTFINLELTPSGKKRSPRKHCTPSKKRLNQDEAAAIAIAAAAALVAPNADGEMVLSVSSNTDDGGKPSGRKVAKPRKAYSRNSPRSKATNNAINVKMMTLGERISNSDGSMNFSQDLGEFDIPCLNSKSTSMFQGLSESSSKDLNPFEDDTALYKRRSTTRLEKLREENTGFNLDSGLGPRARSPRKIILKRSFSDGYVGQLTPSKRQKSSTIATANKVRASSVELSHESTSSKRQTLRSATKKNSKKTSTLKNGSNTASSPMTPPPSGSKATSFFRHMSTRSSNSDRSNDDFEDSEMLQWDVAEYKSATHSLYSSPVSSPRRGATRSQSARQNQHGPKKILTQASHIADAISPKPSSELLEIDDNDAFYFEDLDPEDIERVSGNSAPARNSKSIGPQGTAFASDKACGEDVDNNDVVMRVDFDGGDTFKLTNVDLAVNAEGEDLLMRSNDDQHQSQRLFYLFEVSGNELAGMTC